MLEKTKIVISLTTYPKRVATIWKTIESLLNQTVKPDMICLYLSAEQFRNHDDYRYLDKYRGETFNIFLVEGDLKSHKKYFYSLRDFEDSIVITVDDDIIYSNNMVEELIQYHSIYPMAVIARRGYVIRISEDARSIMPYNSWIYGFYDYYTKPRHNLFATTGGGTLYPPHCFGKEVFNEEVIMNICPYADDIWMKVMEEIYEIPVFLIPKRFSDEFMDEYSKDGLWYSYNVTMNDKQLDALCDKYKEYSILKKISDYDESELEIRIRERIHMRHEQMDGLREIIGKFEGDVVLFGAGNIGHLLLEYLKTIGLNTKVSAFVSSEVKQKAELRVVGIEELKNRYCLIIVSVDINNQEEIIKYLFDNDINMRNVIVLTELQIEYLKKRDEI